LTTLLAPKGATADFSRLTDLSEIHVPRVFQLLKNMKNRNKSKIFKNAFQHISMSIPGIIGAFRLGNTSLSNPKPLFHARWAFSCNLGANIAKPNPSYSAQENL
jgi:hypothetical protein